MSNLEHEIRSRIANLNSRQQRELAVAQALQSAQERKRQDSERQAASNRQLGMEFVGLIRRAGIESTPVLASQIVGAETRYTKFGDAYNSPASGYVAAGQGWRVYVHSYNDADIGPQSDQIAIDDQGRTFRIFNESHTPSRQSVNEGQRAPFRVHYYHDQVLGALILQGDRFRDGVASLLSSGEPLIISDH